MGYDEGRLLDALHHIGHGKGLARARDPEEHLLVGAGSDVLDELLDSLGLVAGRHISVSQLKSGHKPNILTPGQGLVKMASIVAGITLVVGPFLAIHRMAGISQQDAVL